MTGAPLIVLLSVLQQLPSTAQPRSAASASAMPSSGVAAQDSGVGFHVALEAGAQVLPSGSPGGGLDGFAVVLPRLVVDGGDEFRFELGAPLRLRLLDSPPVQEPADFGGRLRRQDWDEPSDFGQLVRELRVGRPDGFLFLEAGMQSVRSVGLGRLVNRYDNQLNPDYHPAGASLVSWVGPIHLELFASDVLAQRLFAGEVMLDIGRVASPDTSLADRFHVALGAALDFGQGGGTSPAITASQLTADAIFYKGEEAQVGVRAAGGARLGTESLDPSAAFGLMAAGVVDSAALALSGRLEGRYQQGGFRFGLFGPSYELARFSGTGLGEVPLSTERLVPGFSGYGEVEVAVGGGMPDSVELSASASGEYFVATGRVDADAALQVTLPGGNTTGAVRVILTDILEHPRYAYTLEARHRFLSSLYAFVGGGAVHFAQANGTLVRGFTGTLGVGVDFER